MNLRIPQIGDVYYRLSDKSVWICCAQTNGKNAMIQRQGSEDTTWINPATDHEFVYVDVAELLNENQLYKFAYDSVKAQITELHATFKRLVSTCQP